MGNIDTLREVVEAIGHLPDVELLNSEGKEYGPNATGAYVSTPRETPELALLERTVDGQKCESVRIVYGIGRPEASNGPMIVCSTEMIFGRSLVPVSLVGITELVSYTPLGRKRTETPEPSRTQPRDDEHVFP